ncbi:hypothetical protein, conserved [Plasmodium gonderi]|uniref:Uncharacterized protein n=1 Tax=Plasmodium gonderi TaxID=77519 RepID=A0A1Y1JIF0_PLAGO|nr:hypothetical protein, conserved [Plasmodium gonderi]GAW81408.1 hypothetical protein, conserved [Plasmodium gonderi]
MEKDNSGCKAKGDMNEGSIEKYHGNPFTNLKEDYYNEKIQRIICAILVRKNIKKVNVEVFDLLFNFFMKIIKTIGMNCRKFSSLRGSVVVNYIDIKYCIKVVLNNVYNDIYITNNFQYLFDNCIYDIEEHDENIKIKNHNYINVLQNSYLYYKQLCMKQKEKYETMDNLDYVDSPLDNINRIDSLQNLSCLNNLVFGNSTSNENVNVLFLNENIDIEKYKEIMKLKKKYVHDHMPIIPLTLNRKEKKTGYYNDKMEYYEELSSSSSSSVKSSSSSSSNLSDPSSDYSEFFNQVDQNVSEKDMYNTHTKDDIGQEKMQVLNLLPKLKDIYTQNGKRAQQNNDTQDPNEFLFNSLNIFETKEKDDS